MSRGIHRISETILLLCARDYHLPRVIAAAQTLSCLHPSPPFGSLAPQRPVTIPIAGGTAVPGGLVQHVFSPPARIEVCAQPFCRGRALKTLSGMQCTAYRRVRARPDLVIRLALAGWRRGPTLMLYDF